MKRQPLTRQKSRWVESPLGLMPGMPRIDFYVKLHERRVHDGTLRAIVAPEPDGLHMSISFTPASTAGRMRYPSWDEIADAREQLLPDDRCFAMHLPPSVEYVSLHPTTFHLFECKAAS